MLSVWGYNKRLRSLSQLINTHVTSKLGLQQELETPLSKALIEDNSYLLSKLITQHKTFLNQPCGDT